MRCWPILVGPLLPGFAFHSAPPVTTNSRIVAGTARATGPQGRLTSTRRLPPERPA
jgi:hypothetical protein